MKSQFTLFLLFFTLFSFSQSTIGNLDFEDSNFNNWTTINGTVVGPPLGTPRPFVFSSFGILNGGSYALASHFLIDSQHNDQDVSFIKAL